MASPSTVFAESFNPPDVTGHKLDRLLELRAVIDSLRREQEFLDPLLNWIVERETPENH
jgi:hypothetical protein